MISRSLSSGSTGMAVRVQADSAAAASRRRKMPVLWGRIWGRMTFSPIEFLLSVSMVPGILPAGPWKRFSGQRFTSSHELALRGWGAGVHVAAPVQVVVRLGSAADHAGVEEQRE